MFPFNLELSGNNSGRCVGLPCSQGFNFSPHERAAREPAKWVIKWLTRVATRIRPFVKRMCESYQRESDISLWSQGFWWDFVQRVGPTWLKISRPLWSQILFTPEKKTLSAGFSIFSRKKRVTKTSRSNVILAHFSIRKVILDHFRSF